MSPGRWLLLGCVLVAALPAQQAPATPPGLDPERFASRDLESRWLTYRKSRHAGAKVELWVGFLEARRDFELLEMMAIYEGFAGVFDKAKPGAVLLRHRHKSWIRVALWNLRARDSHNMQRAVSPLEAQPALLWSYLERYPKARALGGAKLGNILKNHKRPAVLPDSSRYLPPLDPAVLLRPLLALRKDLPERQPDQVPRPGQVYAHRLRRAIRVLGQHASWTGPEERRHLQELCDHPTASIRRAALLCWQAMPAHQVPVRHLLAIYDQPKRAAAERRLAVLALLKSGRPIAWVAAQRLIRDPAAVGWEDALRMLAGWSDSFTARQLQQQRRRLTDARRRALLDQTARAIAQRRMKARRKVDRIDGATIQVILLRLAWARHHAKAVHATYLAYLRQDTSEAWNRAKVQQRLAALAAGRPIAGVPDEVRQEHRRLIQLFLKR